MGKFKEKIYYLLQKNKTLGILSYCFVRRNDTDFVERVMGDTNDYSFLKVFHYGEENKGRTICCINESEDKEGMFCQFLFLLLRLTYADQHGMVPYVYWGDTHLCFEEDGVDGEKNAFLYYFNQVSEVVSIEKAANVFHCTCSYLPRIKESFHTFAYEYSDECLDAMTEMIRKYIRFNTKTEEYLNQSFETLLSKTHLAEGDVKLLGVHYRGTDFKRQYNNHPVPLALENEINLVENVVREKQYDYIFLATDEAEAVKAFRDKFGEKLLVYEDVYRALEGDESVAYSHSDRYKHKYNLGLEVIRDAFTLMKCDGLLGGISNVTISAQLMRKAWSSPYSDVVIVNQGYNHNENAFADAVHV